MHLENELQLRWADGSPTDALQACAEEWESKTDELVDALFLQLNNELEKEGWGECRKTSIECGGRY